MPKDGPNPMALLGAGLEMAAAVVVLTLAGWWGDGKLGTSPWLLLTGLALGMIGGTYKLWRLGRRFF